MTTKTELILACKKFSANDDESLGELVQKLLAYPPTKAVLEAHIKPGDGSINGTIRRLMKGGNG